MLGRRLLLLVAVLMGLTALAASLAPPPQTGRGPFATPTPSPTPTPPAEAGPGAGETVSARLSASRNALPRDIRAAPGDVVQLVVTGDVVDAVTIPGLAVLEPIDPDSPARVDLYADAPGSFPIRLLDEQRRIGTLRISG